MNIFLSHSSTDKALVEKIYNGLEPIVAWLDRAEIEWGEVFLEKITDGIQNASDFMLFWSSSARKSEWVRLELNMAFIRMLSEKAIRLRVVLLDKTTLPLYLKPYHFIDVSESADPVADILKRIESALKEPLKAQRHRFLNRNRELERIELAIDDSETFIICATGFQGIGKGVLLDESIRRFFEGSDAISIDVTGGTDLIEFALKLNAHARKTGLSEGLVQTQLEQELALSLETLAKTGRFLILKNVQHWLDEDSKPISPLNVLLIIAKTIPAFKKRPIFLSSTRKLNIDPADAGGVTQIFTNGLEPSHISTLIRLWYEITEGEEISHEDALIVAKELYGHPIAAKLAAGLIGQYGIKYLQEVTHPFVQLRRDLARHLISELKLSANTKLLMESLSVARTSLPASVLAKTLELSEEDFHFAINQASRSGFLMHGRLLEAHPLLLDYFWRTSWAREDYKPYAKKLAEAVWDYAKTFSTNSAEFSELLPVSVRLFALAGDAERAQKIRADLFGELGEAAVDHYNRRNYELAEQFIDIVLSIDSKNWRMRLYKARVNVRKEKWGDADKILRELLKERANDKGALHALGWRYLRAKAYDKAIEQFVKVIALGDHVSSLRDAAECLHEQGHDDEALKFISRAKSVESDNPYVLDLEARIYEEKEEFELAYEAARIAVIRNPVDWSLHHRLGRILMALNRANEAVTYFEKAIEIGPQHFTARSSLVDAMLDLRADIGVVRVQLADARRTAKTPSEEAVVANLEARCLVVEGKQEEAGKLLEVEIVKGKNLIHNFSLLAEIGFSQYYKEKDTFPASAKAWLEKAKRAIEQGLQQKQNDKKLNELKERLTRTS
jgi:tetratricopeptide (TPR) repeat protein